MASIPGWLESLPVWLAVKASHLTPPLPLQFHKIVSNNAEPMPMPPPRSYINKLRCNMLRKSETYVDKYKCTHFSAAPVYCLAALPLSTLAAVLHGTMLICMAQCRHAWRHVASQCQEKVLCFVVDRRATSLFILLVFFPFSGRSSRSTWHDI